MKRIVFSVLLSAAGAVAAQAPAPAAPQPEPIKAEPIKPGPAKPEAAKPKAAAAKHTNRRSEDARQCLDKATNTDIIKCAEEYL
jgi:hypothetical protein